MFVRVRDQSTGHEFDVPEADKRIGGAFELVRKKQYPPSPSVRRPKHNVGPVRGAAKNVPPKSAEEPKEEAKHG